MDAAAEPGRIAPPPPAGPGAGGPARPPARRVPDEFGRLLVAAIPVLRIRARRLERGAAAREDLVQETLLRALAARDGFLPGTNFNAWAAAIMRNLHLHGRRRLAVAERGAAVLHLGIDGSEPPRHEDRLEVLAVERDLGGLPSRQRQVLRLVALDGLSYEHAASAIGVPVGTVRSRLARARARLRGAVQAP